MRKLFNGLLLIAISIIALSCATADVNDKPGPLIIQEQGSFAVGGTVRLCGQLALPQMRRPAATLPVAPYVALLLVGASVSTLAILDR